MTDTSAPAVELTPFEGLPVLEVGAELPGLAGGLRDAVAVSPVEHRHGEEVYLLVKATTGKVRHEPITKNKRGPQRRVHVYDAETVTFVDEAVAASHIADMEHRIEQLRLVEFAEKKKITVDQALFWQAHEAGQHDDSDVGPCPLCEKERVEAGGSEDNL